jgi:hypothetical protein
MNALESVLRRRIHDTPRARAYQEGLDLTIDSLKLNWDLKRGLSHARDIPMGQLPHESVAGFWELTAQQQAMHTKPEHADVYLQNRGREGTSILCQCAFCWYSPLSRHHQDPELLTFFENGLKFHLDAIRSDGLLGTYGYNGLHWAHGWDIEGLIYGMIFSEGSIDGQLVALARQRMRASATRMLNLPKQPSIIGSFGNQRCVYTLGLYLYGLFLGDQQLIDESDRLWLQALPTVLDESGQVIEQGGPCMHYSHTAFIYAWMNLVIRGDETQHERVLACLNWFRDRLTQSHYPIAGPTTRMYYESIAVAFEDLCPAIEQVAHLDPSLLDFMHRGLWSVKHPGEPIPAEAGADSRTFHITHPHAASVAIWSILMAQPHTKLASPGEPRRHECITRFHDTTHLLKRAPLRYMLVRRRYQTHFNFTDYMPFGGMQTWAWEDQPPLIHPTPLYPSTTRAIGIDTARQGTSHNWGGYGAGAIGIDGYPHYPNENSNNNALLLLASRYDWLFRVVIFTDSSTLTFETGHQGPRETYWTLNRIQGAQAVIDPPNPGIIRFEGQTGTLHHTPQVIPQIITRTESHPWAVNVKQVKLDTPCGPTLFGISNGSLKPFAHDWLSQNTFTFTDDTGSYQITLHPGLLERNNPGGFCIDTYEFAKQTFARRL